MATTSKPKSTSDKPNGSAASRTDKPNGSAATSTDKPDVSGATPTDKSNVSGATPNEPILSKTTRVSEQATAEFKAGQSTKDRTQFTSARSAQDAAAAEAIAQDTRDAVRTSTDLTVELWERNVALASRFVPAYLDSYERTVKSFSSLWEQAGQSARQVGESATSAPQAVTSSFTLAGQAVSEIPQHVGNALTSAGKAISQVPQSIGESISGQIPQTFPDLAKAQATFLREAAEASAAAFRQGAKDVEQANAAARQGVRNSR